MWDDYNAFYERVGPTALPEEVTESTWRRFFDANEPVHCVVAERDGKLVGTVTAANIAQGFVSTGLKANTTYKFTVQAVDTSGNVSLMSLVLSLKTLA